MKKKTPADPEDLFAWRAHVQAGGSFSSQEAAQRLLEGDTTQRHRILAWLGWQGMVRAQEAGELRFPPHCPPEEAGEQWSLTPKEFEFRYLPSTGLYGPVGMRTPKSKSIARRHCDLVWKEEAKYPLPNVLRLFGPTGKRFKIAKILSYTDWGLAVLANPALMEPHWGTVIHYRAKRKPIGGRYIPLDETDWGTSQ